jgi:hypothetical protein
MHNTVLGRHITAQDTGADLIEQDIGHIIFDRKVETGARGGDRGGRVGQLRRVDECVGEDLTLVVSKVYCVECCVYTTYMVPEDGRKLLVGESGNSCIDLGERIIDRCKDLLHHDYVSTLAQWERDRRTVVLAPVFT